MVNICLKDVSKEFGRNPHSKRVLGGIDLSVRKGEVLAIRGDNGSGKTTLLNLIAGLDLPTAGSIQFDGLSEKPRIGFAQQDYTSSLLPWLTVVENVALPLRILGIPKTERKDRASVLLDSLGFSSLPLLAFPHQLSGGQRQRVAISRALMHNPHLVILDEPFANLDAHTMRDLQNTLSDVHEAKHPTMLLVSHEIGHCIFLADRIVILHGSPATIVKAFEVSLPRPRHRTVMFTAESAGIRSEILEAEEALYAKGR